MARTLTTNLKLILDETITASARYNLQRLDSLGETFIITENANVEIRAENNIILRPNASEAGGTGSGGQLNISTLTQPLDLFQIYSTAVKVSGGQISLENSGFDLTFQAPVLTEDVSFIFPDESGSSGQILSTDGAGNLSWANNAAGGQGSTFTWAPVDGTIKTISHNFGTQELLIDVYDTVTENKVGIDKIEFVSDNVIQLTSLDAPESAGYKVFIKEI